MVGGRAHERGAQFKGPVVIQSIGLDVGCTLGIVSPMQAATQCSTVWAVAV